VNGHIFLENLNPGEVKKLGRPMNCVGAGCRDEVAQAIIAPPGSVSRFRDLAPTNCARCPAWDAGQV